MIGVKYLPAKGEPLCRRSLPFSQVRSYCENGSPVAVVSRCFLCFGLSKKSSQNSLPICLNLSDFLTLVTEAVATSLLVFIAVLSVSAFAAKPITSAINKIGKIFFFMCFGFYWYL